MKKSKIDLDFSEIERRIISRMENDEPLGDIHSERAVLHFNIPIEEVTDEQRKAIKNLYFLEMYTCTGRIKRNIRPDFQRIKRNIRPDFQRIKR